MKTQIKLQISILILCTFCVQSAHAALGSAYSGFMIHYGAPDLDGSFTSYSYSRVDTTEDSDVDFGYYYGGMWLADTETLVDLPEGVAQADSIVPLYLAENGAGNTSVEVNEAVETRSWTSITHSWLQGQALTTDYVYMYTGAIDLPSGMTGIVTFCTALWEGPVGQGNFLLTEKDGWTLDTLSHPAGDLQVLKMSIHTGSLEPDLYISWPTTVQSGQEYSFFAYTEVQVVPEPVTLGFMILGSMIAVRGNRGKVKSA